MILIADSGSTKTEWCLADQGRPVRTVVTAGTNPYFQTREEERGTTILVVTHNREIVNEMKKRVITMKKGVVISDEEKGGYIDED